MMLPEPAVSSTGLPSHVAGALAYAGWWITGILFWLLERDDRFVRFHAAQAATAFGGVALVVGICCAGAALALSFMPAAFSWFLWAAGLTWLCGIGLWLVAMWKAATGVSWRIPIAARVADRLVEKAF